MESGREAHSPSTSTAPATNTAERDLSPTLNRDSSTSRALSHPGQNPSSKPPSLTTSPQSSRTTSPVRLSARPQESSRQIKSTGPRSRKDSADQSPHRPVSAQASTTGGPPSAAAIQRALSAANAPQLQHGPGPVTDAISRLPRSSKNSVSEGTPNGISSVSPRVRSPGPFAIPSRKNSLRKADHASAPPITVQSSTPPNPSIDPAKLDINSESQPLQTPKASTRGPSGPKTNLETVQEATPPAAGSVLGDLNDQAFNAMNSAKARTADSEPKAAQKKDNTQDKRQKTESDGDGNKSDGRSRKDVDLTIDSNKAKLSSVRSGPPSARLAKQGEGTRNMTVETETVASIPQSALSADRSANSRGDGGGSIRLKPSYETIRPRKDKKKPPRKAASIHNGTASSKADIFEARVASQVDEAESSDSDETFVYESNPPEPHQIRAHRSHSRTPSVTSVQSQSDRRMYMANQRVAGKRSMKFSSNPYSVLDSPTDGETGTIRAHHPRNISRFGRTIGSNSSIYDQDSPFTQASKLRQNLANSTRQSSRPSTPSGQKGNGQSRPPTVWGKNKDGSSYDFDGEGADDERVPLMGTVRTPRNRHTRRSYRQYEQIYSVERGSWVMRYAGYVLTSVVVLLVLLGAVGFLFMSNKIMYDVDIAEIRNVLASEQEIMLDMVVGAVNPNVLSISVTEMDLSLYAKSKHLAITTTPQATATVTATATVQPRPTGHARRLASSNIAGTPWQDKDGHWHDGDDSSGEEGDSQMVLLGRVSHFDQGLYFEGSPFKRHAHYSIGEFRLPCPGNRTDAARWDRVLQFPFELIVRGVLHYSLPISSAAHSATVSASVVVHPESGVDDNGRMRVEPPPLKDDVAPLVGRPSRGRH